MVELTLNSDEEILIELTNGDYNYAVNSFVRKYQSFVYATAYRFLNNYDDAEDASQEIFIKAINSLHKFKKNSSLKTWLYKITKNYCNNLILRNKFKNIFRINKDTISENFDFISKDLEPDKLIEKDELINIFNQIINKLPEKQRETFVLRFYEEMSYEEISELIGTSIGGLKANYFQAIKKIEQEFKKYPWW